MKNRDWWMGFFAAIQVVAFFLIVLSLVLILMAESASAQTWDWLLF